MSRRYRPFDPFERGGPFEPGREIRLPRVPQRFWAALALFVLAVLVFIATSPIIGFITEVEWYDALGLRNVYTTRLWLEWSITLVSFVVAFADLAVNPIIALRVPTGVTPPALGIRPSGPPTAPGWVSLAAAPP